VTLSFVITDESGPLTFTQPRADGVMYCNGEMCCAAGQLAGADPYIVGHRPLRAAAQSWYLTRSQLIVAYQGQAKQPWPFMQKELPGEPAVPPP
jgi:hypothetical protein